MVVVGVVAAAARGYGAIPPGPTLAPLRPVVEDYFGTKVVDPYRYIENLTDPEVQAWMHAQNDYTRRVLGSISGRAKLLTRIKALNSSAPAEITNVRRVPGGRIFYLKRSAAEEVAKLYTREGLTGSEKLIADPSKYDVPGGPHNSIQFFFVSQDGHYVAVGGGHPGDYLSIKVFDTVTLKESGETIDRAFFGIGFVPSVWRPDNHSFFYTRLRDLGPGAPPSEILQNSQVYLHVIGTDPDKDQPVFGGTLSPLVKVGPVDVPTIGSSWSALRFGADYFFRWPERLCSVCCAPRDGGKTEHALAEGMRRSRRGHEDCRSRRRLVSAHS
jgi:prolyl oligopeptidase